MCVFYQFECYLILQQLLKDGGYEEMIDPFFDFLRTLSELPGACAKDIGVLKQTVKYISNHIRDLPVHKVSLSQGKAGRLAVNLAC